MAEGMDSPVDDTERRRELSKENANKSAVGEPELNESAAGKPESSPSPPKHRRGRRSPPPPEIIYKRRRPSYSPSPPPPYRDRRVGHSESPSPSPPRYRHRRGAHSPSPSPPYHRRRGGHSPSPSPSPPLPPYRDHRGVHSPSLSPPLYRDRRGGYSPSPSPPAYRDRRAMHSPFPPAYRDRRAMHSPSPPRQHRDRPRRSPPFPPYKRLRRDDYQGRYHDRRGRGYGPGDRRYGYDYQAGYEPETGGRLGYYLERPHGRLVGHSSDRVTGHDGFPNVLGVRSNQSDGLKSYKQFIQELEDDILPAEAECRYQEYKSGYIEAHKRAYFDAHKDEEWLKDKYHPTNLISVIERRNELAQKLAKDFFLDMQSGTLDIGPSVTPASANKPGHSSEPNPDEEADDGGKRRQHGTGHTKDTDLLSAVLEAHQVSAEPRRVRIDIEQALELVRKLDREKGVEGNILFQSDIDIGNKDKFHGNTSGPIIIIKGLTSVKGLEGTELLDTVLTYLWRIHGVDYYGMTETNEAKGLRHVRVEGGGASSVTTNGAEWEKKLDTHWQGRLKGQDPLELMTAKDKIDTAANECLDPYVRKIKDEKYGWKYGCGAKGCTKLFHATVFVHKHLKLKHLDLVMELTSKVRNDLYFQNFMNDENAPGGTPIMQPSIRKEKALTHRRGPAGRVKNDTGNRRDHDGRANGGERTDRSENPQSADFQPKNDGASKDKHDAHMFDSSGGQGIPLAPFSLDVAPPPILIPAPGAGPLGPFIPAPPEVAMRMIREQGGSSPFVGGRSGLSGPATNRPAPNALPPAFRQDPRHLRSYQDLDAPNEEVTVIDYRSL